MATRRDFHETVQPIEDMNPRRSISIEDMIRLEDDPKQRSFLIVLNSINNALLANTATVRDIKETLDDHLRRYAQDITENAAIKNQGRGMWRVLAWVLGFVQASLLAGGAALWSDVKENRATLTSLISSDVTVSGRVDAVEKRVTALEHHP